MELFEALYTTRAMRRMQPRDVPDELIPHSSTPRFALRAAAASRTGASS